MNRSVALWYTGITITDMGRPRIPIEKRFWSKVDIMSGDECWNWKGKISSPGYGSIWFNGGDSSAHRWAWTLTNGPIPDGMFVCHRCDNRKCCNPGHLFIGTHQENLADMRSKGRGCKGTMNPGSKLTEQLVTTIRSLLGSGVSQKVIASEFGVNQSVISRISCGHVWRHVKGG